ncbi:MAG: XRE family transcriptional regulator [Gammaproteobacteria bacterium]|nr:MAG: XRE family transcriptional regulator [Gammaproteobacteria bacterium]
MIIQKLRLERGWSQQQLAEMSGLSQRTIQRIENGKTPSVESVKSLAAVFEVDFSTLNGTLTMNNHLPIDGAEATTNNPNTLTLSRAEQFAYKKVREIKRFYVRLFIFAVVISLLFIINLITTPQTWWVQWVFLGWGTGLVIRGLKTFDFLPLLGIEWEKRQLEKYLKQKR